MTDTIHHWGPNAQSPCGLDVAQVYRGVKGHGFASSWIDVNCPACLKSRTSGTKSTAQEEPSYMAFARQFVRMNQPCSPTIVAELLAKIDRQAQEIQRLENLTTRLH